MLPSLAALFGFSTLNGSSVAAGSVTVNNGAISILGLANAITPESISNYSITAYAAGTKAKKTVTPGAVVDLQEYSIKVTRVTGNDPQGITTPPTPIFSKTYSIFTGVSDSATTICDKFRAAITADLQAFVVATGTTTLILEMADTLSDFVIDLSGFSTATQAVTTAYVAPSGTPAIVGAIDPANVSATANYTTYVITYRQRRQSGLVENSYVSKLQTVVVFADALATNYAAFNTRLTNLLANDALDNLLQFGHEVAIAQPVAINSTATATAAQMLAGVITSTSAAATTITTPTAAAIYALINGAQAGMWVDLVIDNTAGSNTVTLALDATITVAKQTSAGDSASGQLLTVASGAAGVGIFRFYFSSATAATAHRIG